MLHRYLAPLPILGCLAALPASATTISGTVYCGVSSSVANNTPTPGSTISSGTECATFQSSAINFYNPSGATSTNNIGSFLGSEGVLLGSVNYLNGYTASSTLDYSVFLFTGYAYFQNGQTYSATHDDGTVMAVNGTTVINKPAATSSRTDSFTWTGATGNYNFQYDFSEAQGATIYQTNATNTPTPEPSTFVFLGTGLALFAFCYQKRRSIAGTPMA